MDMNFQTIFRSYPQSLQKNCILVPHVTRSLLEAWSVKDYQKTGLYGLGQARNFTLIYCRMGTAFCGDAVLALEDTPCENIFLFGSCGAVSRTDRTALGSLVVPEHSVSLDSFCRLLNNDLDFNARYAPDAELLKNLLDFDTPVHTAICATLGSIVLEPCLAGSLLEKGIDIVDMECAAFFHAASVIGKKAVALFYVSDIFGQDTPYAPLSAESHRLVADGRLKGQELLSSYLQGH